MGKFLDQLIVHSMCLFRLKKVAKVTPNIPEWAGWLWPPPWKCHNPSNSHQITFISYIGILNHQKYYMSSLFHHLFVLWGQHSDEYQFSWIFGGPFADHVKSRHFEKKMNFFIKVWKLDDKLTIRLHKVILVCKIGRREPKQESF